MTTSTRNWRHTKENKPNGGPGATEPSESERDDQAKTERKEQQNLVEQNKGLDERQTHFEVCKNQKWSPEPTASEPTETKANANENTGTINGCEENDELILKNWIAKWLEEKIWLKAYPCLHNWQNRLQA